jgi:hypothetical protein
VLLRLQEEVVVEVHHSLQVDHRLQEEVVVHHNQLEQVVVNLSQLELVVVVHNRRGNLALHLVLEVPKGIALCFLLKAM